MKLNRNEIQKLYTLRSKGVFIRDYPKGNDRNSLCLCGSGKKYKKCCGGNNDSIS